MTTRLGDLIDGFARLDVAPKRIATATSPSGKTITRNTGTDWTHVVFHRMKNKGRDWSEVWTRSEGAAKSWYRKAVPDDEFEAVIVPVIYKDA